MYFFDADGLSCEDRAEIDLRDRTLEQVILMPESQQNQQLDLGGMLQCRVIAGLRNRGSCDPCLVSLLRKEEQLAAYERYFQFGTA